MNSVEEERILTLLKLLEETKRCHRPTHCVGLDCHQNGTAILCERMTGRYFLGIQMLDP